MLEDCSGNSGRSSRNDGEFERFDDDQFMSMFSDEASGNPMMPPTMSSSNPSSPSDHNSINDEKETMNKEKEQEMQQQQVKNESDEDESQCKREITQVQNNDNSNTNNANATTCSSDRITDPKRVKR